MKEMTDVKNLVFKHFYTNEIVDTKEHILQFLNDNPGALITIGSDSLSHKKFTVYATIIALFYPTVNGVNDVSYNKGAHLIYTKCRIPKVKDLYIRLWKEVEMTQFVADYIEETIFNTNLNDTSRNVEIHVDLNPNVDYKSNMLFKSTMGMFTSMGYTIKAKPESWVATCAADVIANH